MRLRNLFMILLLCMTVGMFGVSCTGDDGAQGPPGPKGDTGEPGEDAAGGAEVEYSYSFLKTWGSGTGAITCNSPLLTETGMFPGPATLDLLPDNNNDGSPDIDILEVQCGNNVTTADESTALFVPVGLIKAGTTTIGASGTSPVGFTVAGELVFLKSHEGIEGPSAPEEVASTETVKAKSVVTTKKFAGGALYATLNTTGGNIEAIQRADLSTNCSKGTDPPNIGGEWRAVRIIKDETLFDASKDPVALTAGGLTRSTTTKVCLRLDSIPGTVKCFVETGREVSNGDSNGVPTFANPTMIQQQIAIYDGMAEEGKMLTAVAPLAHKTTKLLPPTTVTGDVDTGVELGTAANGNVEQANFFENADSLSAADTSKLCNLFEEGLK